MIFWFKFIYAQEYYGEQTLTGRGLSLNKNEPEVSFNSLLSTVSFPQLAERTGTFQPGDAVRITIWREPQLSGDFSISSNGTVQLPLIGKVQVQGLTTMSLSSFLKAEFGAYLREPDIQVVPLIRVSVLGGVGKPGLFRAEPESSLWDLIAEAGGPVRGRVKDMRVLRSGKVVIKDILTAYERGDSLLDIGIRTGDQITVPTNPKFSFSDVLRITTAAIGVAALIISISRN